MLDVRQENMDEKRKGIGSSFLFTILRMLKQRQEKKEIKLKLTRFKQAEVHFKKLKIINRLMGDRT
jgi:hypothetical protein